MKLCTDSSSNQSPVPAGRRSLFLKAIPLDPERPTWVVLHNFSVQKAQCIQARIVALAAKGVHLFFLPPYSPELHRIEPCWHDIKHYRMQQPIFKTEEGLLEGVEQSLTNYAEEKAGRTKSLPQPA
jgi:transposase